MTADLESLRAVQHVLARLTNALSVGVVQIDAERTIVHQNGQASELLDRPGSADLDALFSGVVADHGRLEAALTAVLRRGEDGELDVSARRRDGRPVRCRLSLRALGVDGAVTGALICIDDMTDGTRSRAHREPRATYDALTGCLDRGSTLAALDRALVDAHALGTAVAVVLVGVDGSTAIANPAGANAEVENSRRRRADDARLQKIAEQLRDVSRSGDVVGRVAHDELMVIARGVHTPSEAMLIADRVAAALRRNIAKQPTCHAVASIGVSWVHESATVSPDVLVAEADAAMYASQREGRGRPVLHSSSEWTPDQSSASR